MVAKKKKTVLAKRKAVKKTVSKETKLDIQDESKKDLSLMDRVIRENEEVSSGGRRGGKGYKREVARMAFAMWLTIPGRYRGAPDNVLEILGLDGDMLELARIATQKEFGQKCGVAHTALAEWRKDIMDGDDGKDIRRFFHGLKKDALAALYRKLIETGDADKFKAFMAYVEGWVPGSPVGEGSGGGVDLRPDERAHLDRLIERNSVRA